MSDLREPSLPPDGPSPRPSRVPAGTSRAHRALAYALRPIARVDAGEVVTALVMTFTVFVLLTSYYILKTAREPLILMQGGAEVKQYASAGQCLLLIPVVRAYGALAKRVGRMKLVGGVYAFFFVNLLLFAFLSWREVRLGVVFYLWVGIFNVTVIAQFWSFANDIYTPEQGKRLFAVLGIGSSVGAVAGARIAKLLVKAGPPTMMLVAAGLLVACIGLLAFVEARQGRAHAHAKDDEPEAPLGGEQMFRTLMRDRYLLAIGALTLLLNWVNHAGEYMIDRALLDSAHAGALAAGVTETQFVGIFKAEYLSYYSIGGVVLQLFAVSRIMRIAGVRRALFLLPLVSFVGYAAIVAFPVLRVVQATKVAENALDYSLQNTVRNALFLVTGRVEKYVGKAIIDTVLMRAGDVLAAVTVAIGAWLSLSLRTFALINVVLTAFWVLSVVVVGREHRKKSPEHA